MGNLKSDPFSAFGKFVLTMAVTAGLIIARGVVISVFWAWFFVPALGVRPISTAAALGISLTARMTLSLGSGNTEGKGWSQIATAEVVTLVLVVFLGFLFKQWV